MHICWQQQSCWLLQLPITPAGLTPVACLVCVSVPSVRQGRWLNSLVSAGAMARGGLLGSCCQALDTAGSLQAALALSAGWQKSMVHSVCIRRSGCSQTLLTSSWRSAILCVPATGLVTFWTSLSAWQGTCGA